MDSVHIPHILKAPGSVLGWEFKDFLEGLDTLTPVRGKVRVRHRGRFLEVEAQAEGIVTLTCDRCLGQYNHRLTVDTQEFIWLREPTIAALSTPEDELSLEDLEEELPPDGEFHPTEWLYEQMCLALPMQKLCSPDCGGIEVAPVDQDAPSVDGGDEADDRGGEPVDDRWAQLQALKRQLEGR
ncbi:MAG: DUF177 domain-containing protein [Cyanophyceae cyanobacterium]